MLDDVGDDELRDNDAADPPRGRWEGAHKDVEMLHSISLNKFTLNSTPSAPPKPCSEKQLCSLSIPGLCFEGDVR